MLLTATSCGWRTVRSLFRTKAMALAPMLIHARLVGGACYQANIALGKVGQLVRLSCKRAVATELGRVVATDCKGFKLGYIDPETWLHQALQEAQARCTAKIAARERGSRGELYVVLILQLAGEPIKARVDSA